MPQMSPMSWSKLSLMMMMVLMTNQMQMSFMESLQNNLTNQMKTMKKNKWLW